MKKITSKILLVIMMLTLIMSTCLLASAEDSQPVKAAETKVFGFADNTVPRVIGPYLMSYTPETRELGTNIQTITTVLGDINTSIEGEYIEWNDNFFKSHNGVYAFFPEVTDHTSSITLTMPEGVKAISFGLIPASIIDADIKAVADDGTEFTQKYESSNNISTGFVFYSLSSDIKTITITLTQPDGNGFAIGDILVNSYDLRKDFKAVTKEYTGSDLSKDAINTIDQKAFALKVLEQYGILKDMKLTQNNNSVTEAKEPGKYDLEVTVDNLNNDFVREYFSEFSEETPVDQVLTILKGLIALEGYNEQIISTSTFTVKDFLTVNAKPEVVVIPEEKAPLAPVENPKTGAQNAAVALMLVAVASATASVVLKKKSK